MRVLVDFNEVYDDNFIWAVLRRNTVVQGESAIKVGDWVELYDYDGTSCLGRIVQMTDQTIDCEIDWDKVEYATSDIPPFQSAYEMVGYFTQGTISQAC